MNNVGGSYRLDPTTGELVPNLDDEAMRKRAEKAKIEQQARAVAVPSIADEEK